MIVSDKYRLVGITPPKTASTSLHDWFGCRLENQHGTDIPRYATDYTRFTVVRHPCDRFISLWKQFAADEDYELMALDRFVEWLATAKPFYSRSQFSYLCDVRIDRYVRFDTLEADLLAFPEFAGKKLPPLKHLNRTKHDPWQDMVAPQIRHALESLWWDDFRYLEGTWNTCSISNSS